MKRKAVGRNESTNKGMTRKRKAVIINPLKRKAVVYKRNAIVYRFRNSVMSCSCIRGMCPNYEPKCGQNGQAVNKGFSKKMVGRNLKRLLYKDQNVSPVK